MSNPLTGLTADRKTRALDFIRELKGEQLLEQDPRKAEQKMLSARSRALKAELAADEGCEHGPTTCARCLAAANPGGFLDRLLSAQAKKTPHNNEITPAAGGVYTPEEKEKERAEWKKIHGSKPFPNYLQ